MHIINTGQLKHYTLLKLAALSAIFLTAMAFSCQDHNIPDPVSNCNRIDGTPRAVNCEFEFVKADFFRVDYYSGKPDTTRYGTVTPGQPDVKLIEPQYGSWVASYISQFFYIGLQGKVTIKRIAPPPAGSNKYILRKDLVSSPIAEYDSRSGFFELEKDEDLPQVTIDIPVGGTYTYDVTYDFSGRFNYNGDYLDYPLFSNYYLLVQNVKTSQMLRGAPYNYQWYRDIAEARMSFNPKVVPHVCVPCRQSQ